MNKYNSVNKKGMFFNIAHVPSQLDHTQRFTLHSLADLFIPAPTWLLWEAFSQAVNTREDYSFIFPPLSIARYSFMQLSGLGRHEPSENAQILKR